VLGVLGEAEGATGMEDCLRSTPRQAVKFILPYAESRTCLFSSRNNHYTMHR
jgi:hypothetical protein